MALAAVLALGAAAPPVPGPPPDEGRVLDQVIVPRAAPDLPGTTYREFTTTIPAPGGGRVTGDVVEVDLSSPAVRVDLLTPPTVAATATVLDLARRANAVAAVNGDFFDQGGTGAPVGPQIVAGAPRSSGVPAGRRPAPPPPPGESPDAVLGVDAEGVGHIGRVAFRGRVVAGDRTVPLRGLNGYAVPVGGVVVFTPAWGAASRAASTCGSDTDAAAGCSPDTVEVRVADGKVTATGPPGTGALPRGTVALVGRDAGAAGLRALRVGEDVTVDYGFDAVDTPPLRMAVGALPIARGGRALPGLQTSERAPRTAAGLTTDGSRMWLITVDGRQETSVGATLAQLGRLVTELGVPEAVALDGGGSTTMVRRGRDEGLAVVNSPSASPLRAVTDGLAVVPR